MPRKPNAAKGKGKSGGAAAPVAFVSNTEVNNESRAAISEANKVAALKPFQFKPGQSGNPTGRPKGQTELKRLARSYTMEAMMKLVNIMQNEEAPFADQRGAAVEILNRGWGKPLQQVETGRPGDFSDLADAELDAFILDKASQFVEDIRSLN